MSASKEYIRGLQERRTEFRKQREELAQTLKDGSERMLNLNGAIAGIDQLLLLEGINPEPVPAENGKSEQSLAEIINVILSDRKYHSVPELAEEAARKGYVFGKKSPLRAVGFTLMGLARNGKYAKTNDGHWKFSG